MAARWCLDKIPVRVRTREVRTWLTCVAFFSLSLASTSANGGNWQVDFGGAIRGQASLGRMENLAGRGFGLDAWTRVRPPGLHLGLRFETALTLHEGKSTETNTVFLGFLVSGTLITSHSVIWLRAGPEWSVPVGKGWWTLYGMAGYAFVEPRSDGSSVNLRDDRVAASSVLVGGIGSAAILPWPRRESLALEAGIEYEVGGKARFYGDPPIVSDGSGHYVVQTERARLSSFGVRLGMAKRFR